jgi:hypothetical protein
MKLFFSNKILRSTILFASLLNFLSCFFYIFIYFLFLFQRPALCTVHCSLFNSMLGFFIIYLTSFLSLQLRIPLSVCILTSVHSFLNFHLLVNIFNIFVFLSYSNLCQYRNFIIWNFVDKYWDQELRRLCSYSIPLPLPLENRIYSNCQYSSLGDFSVRTMYINRQSSPSAKYDT